LYIRTNACFPTSVGKLTFVHLTNACFTNVGKLNFKTCFEMICKMGTFLSIDKNVRRKIMKEYLDFYDRRLLYLSVGIKYNIASLVDNCVRYGYFNLLKWADGEKYLSSAFSCEIAAYYGKVDILEWLVDRGAYIDGIACKRAIQGNQLKVLQWLYNNEAQWNCEVYMIAIGYGRKEITKWLLQEVMQFDCTNVH